MKKNLNNKQHGPHQATRDELRNSASETVPTVWNLFCYFLLYSLCNPLLIIDSISYHRFLWLSAKIWSTMSTSEIY